MRIRYCLLILLVFITFSCNESDIGIFYGLETEEKIDDNSLPNNVTVGGMVKNDGELYIAAGRVYTKTSGSSEDWDKLPSPSGYDLASSIASDGTNVYALFFDKNSADTALFRMANGGSWIREDESAFDGKIESVKSANNMVFVSTRTSTQDGKLYNRTVGYNEVTDIPLTGSAFNVIFHNANYWISNYNKLYTGADPSAMTEIAAVTDALNVDDEIMGLSPSFIADTVYYTYWDKSRSYVSSTNGSTVIETSDDIIYTLNGLNIISVSGYNFLLAGTSGRGYYELLDPSDTNLEPEKPENNVLADNYTSAIDLQQSVVLDLFVDETQNDLYALTATAGLWKNSESGGSRDWSIE